MCERRNTNRTFVLDQCILLKAIAFLHNMVSRNIDTAVLERIREFIGTLNHESENGSIIVVEGKRDSEALTKLGFVGKVTVFNRFKGILNFVDSHQMTDRKIILLLDMDRTGKYLTSRLVSLLQPRGNNVNLAYKKKLCEITNGKVRHVEDIGSYQDLLGSKFCPLTLNLDDLSR
jgi:5S rRNA maturation endonuclease (ribonuclease M5)